MKFKPYIFIIVGLISCSKPVKKTTDLKFVDIKGYFQKEAIRLTQRNKTIYKTVISSNGTESKKVSNINWSNELNLFIESDLNKPAWKDSYKIIRKQDQVTYKALDSNLTVRQIVIKELKGNKKRFDIFKKDKNILYQALDHLIYIPDSIYQIDKSQNILLIGKNRYVITGKFK